MIPESIMTPAAGEDQGVTIEPFAEGTVNRLWLMIRDGRRYILKGLKEELRLFPQEVARLKKEYHLGIRLNHPGVAITYGFEIHPVTGPVIVTEYVDGRDLSEFIKESPPVATRLKVAVELAEAIGYLHESGVVHRDLKPDNVLVGLRRNDVKLIDLGLGDSEDSIFFKESIGTREFGAPEQQTASPGGVAADVYSFGKIVEKLLPERRFHKIVKECLRENPDERPSIEEIAERLKTVGAPSRIKKILPVVITLLAVAVLELGVYLIIKNVNKASETQLEKNNEAVNKDVGNEVSHSDSIIHGTSGTQQTVASAAPASAMQPISSIPVLNVEPERSVAEGEQPIEESGKRSATYSSIVEKYLKEQDKVMNSYEKLETVLYTDDREGFERYSARVMQRYDDNQKIWKEAESELLEAGAGDADIAQWYNTFWTAYTRKMNRIDGNIKN
ncbi:MAG: serine/threonine protein kinase [Muribaculaceae bacterium]|nr:serine/threonine protein kinase [Muribaculaceae bacterium]